MKKKLIKIIPFTLLAASLAMPTTAFAEYTPDKILEEGVAATKQLSYENKIILNGNVIENAETIYSEGKLMFPVRPVAEALGYTVEWDNDTKGIALINSPAYVTFTVGVDGYSFARTAHMPIGKAPEIINGSTYVPFELLTEIMHIPAETENTNIIITPAVFEETPEEIPVDVPNEKPVDDNTSDDNKTDTEEQKAEYNAVVIEKENSQIHVNDTEKGEVVLNISDLTVLLNEDGEEITLEDINVDDKVFVEYSEAMTMSLPPINNPVSIKLVLSE